MPHISNIRNDFMSNIHEINPEIFEPVDSPIYELRQKFPHIDIVQQPKKTILNEVKSKLRSLNISELSKAKNYTMRNKLKIKKGGLYGNRHFLRTLNNYVPSSSYVPMSQWNQTEAVLIADTLDLRNQTIMIDRNQISEFFIIAKKIIADNSAKIIYYPEEYPRKGQRGRNGQNAVNYSTSAQSGHHARDGRDGQNGYDGTTGIDGEDAPSVKIFVLEIDSMPNIFVQGQQGSQGGAGGTGGNGGRGERGRSARAYSALWTGWWCKSKRGNGGDGGDGGHGGRSGRGGDGGNGGTITIATQQTQIDQLMTTHPFTIDVGGGGGGKPGNQGTPGSYGIGGNKGHDGYTYACDDDAGRKGQNGQNGQRRGNKGTGDKGQDGQIIYSIIDKDDWNLKLESPHIFRLENNRVYAGEQIIIHGVNFVKGQSSVYLDRHTISSHYNHDKQITFEVSENITSGRHTIYIRTSDGDKSNKIDFKVKPYILDVDSDGDSLTVSGRSFSTSATVLYNKRPLEIVSSSNDEIKAKIPEVIGEYNGGQVNIQIVNNDRCISNKKYMMTNPYVNSGFKANPNGWQFRNYSDGIGSLGIFTDVFGADEVTLETRLHPVLTPIYYAFFRDFLRSNGHCSGMALLSLEEFYKGNRDLYLDYSNNSTAIKKRIDTAQGRLLSHELLVHYGDQIDEGIARVEKTLREIESYLSRTSLNSDHARTLSFIPSGSIFDIDSIKESHTVVPRKLVYDTSSRIVEGKRTLDGAKLYIYDNKKPNKDDVYLDIKDVNGTIHYSYDSYSSQGNNPLTLGTWTLKKQLFEDVDLPLNIAFVIDILLSPARIQIEDNNKNILGYKDGKIHTNKDLGYISPWTDKLILSKADIDTNKKILGYDDGTYTFASKHPNGKTLVLENIECSPKTEDTLTIKNEYKEVSLFTKENKIVNLSLIDQDFSSATTMHDGTMKELSIQYESNANKKINFSFDIDDIHIKYDNNLSIDLKTKVYNKSGKLIFENKINGLKLSKTEQLSISSEIWKDKNYQPLIKTR